MSDYYNPAKDEVKLREAVISILPFEGWPSRWKRCLAAEVLQLRERVKELEEKHEPGNRTVI